MTLSLPPPLLLSRTLTLLVWAGAGASLVFWGLRLSSPSAGVSQAAVAQASDAPADPMAVARALGAVKKEARAEAPVPTSSRYALAGVVAGGQQRGVALIAVDGKPARPVRVGSAVEPGIVLQSVEPRRASLGPDLKAPAQFVIELPAVKK